MYFVLDLVCVLIVLISVVHFFKSSIMAVAVKAACVILSAALAVLVSIPCAGLVNNWFVTPSVERRAANELAEKVSAESKATGRETVKGLDLDAIIKERPEDCTDGFVEWVKAYDGNIETACFEYKHSGAETMLVNLTEPLCRNISRAVAYVALWIVFFAVLRILVWKFEWNSAPKQRQRGDYRNVFPPLLGAVYGIFIVWGLAVALEWLVPAIDGMVPLLKGGMLDNGAFYPIMQVCDPLCWLAQL